MLKKLNIRNCDLYVLLWLIYNAQGVVYTAGILSQMSLMVIIAWSSMDFVFLYNKIKGGYFSGVKLYSFYLLILGILLYISGNVYKYDSGAMVINWYYLKDIGMTWLPLFTFYRFASNGKLDISRIRIYTFLFLIMVIMSYLNEQEEILKMLIMTGDSTNNTGYQFLALFPLLYFWKNNHVIQYILLGLIFFFIMICFKRGAIFIGVICSVIFLYDNAKIATGKEKLFLLLISVGALIAGFYYMTNLFENNDYFQNRILSTTTGDSSGRDELYARVLNYITNLSDPLLIVFGGGAYYTINKFGIEAHNDWLETFVCGGIIGMIIYLRYWIKFAYFWLSCRKIKTASAVIGICLLITFAQTFFSMSSISVQMAAPLMLAMFYVQNEKDIN